MKKFLVFVQLNLILFLSSQGLGQADVSEVDYTLGGNCATSGSWTQKALAQTMEIKKIIGRLRRTQGKCSGFADFLEKSVPAGTSDLATRSQSDVGRRLENIPAREAAMASVMDSGNQDFKSGVLRAILREKFNLATANSFSAMKGFEGLNGLFSNEMMDQAADLINAVAGALPDSDFNECLIQNPDLAGDLLGNVAGLSANLVGPGWGVNPSLTSAVRNLVNNLAPKRFSGAQKILSSAQFWHSMSCLVETTAESYCSVLDASHLLNKDYVNQHLTFDDHKPTFGSPLEGYDILALHAPNISWWLKRVQFGIEPQWATDADFKISAFTNVANYLSSSWDILGDFNGLKPVFYRMTTLLSKQTVILNMLSVVVKHLQESNKEAVNFKSMLSSSELNFYTMVRQRDEIPYFLIGVPMPPDAGMTANGVVASWEAKMKGDTGQFERFRPFDNPDTLLHTIEDHLRYIIEEANIKASDFYQDRIIVNQPNLVAAALSSTNFTVYNSFQALYNYLGNLRKLFESTPYDEDVESHNLIGVIADLRGRVGSVLKAFNALEPLQKVHPLTRENKKYIIDTYKNVVKTVYNEFDVLYQRESFINSALVELVRADYAFRIRHNIGFGKYEKDMITASGHDFIDLVRTLHGFNPVKASSDISFALLAGQLNLNAVEKAFTDPFVRAIDEINMYLSGKGSGDLELFRRSGRRLWDDTFVNGVFQRDNYGMSKFSSWFGFWWGPLTTQNRLRKDRYNFPQTADWASRPNGDNYINGNRYFRDQLCILSLAFEHRDDYRNLCKGAVLPSTYSDQTDPSFPLSASYDDIINAKRGPLNSPLEAEYKDNAICAFRNYFRRNFVFRVTQRVQSGIQLNRDTLEYYPDGLDDPRSVEVKSQAVPHYTPPPHQ